ncbi:MAG TPA: 50S ribosomal protein L21 [bacterium]|nr:50S ribosomal protein L21 [bacterium]
MKLAVIKTGGKQYLVKEGTVLKIEKLIGEVGSTIKFNEILMLADEKTSEVKIGKPLIDGAEVAAKILEQGRAKKIKVVHYKPKTRQHKVYGHRQPFTKIQIEKIS